MPKYVVLFKEDYVSGPVEVREAPNVKSMYGYIEKDAMENDLLGDDNLYEVYELVETVCIENSPVVKKVVG